MEASNGTTKELLTYQEAAAVLGTAPAFVEKLVAQRHIAHVKIGHYVRLRRCDLEAYVERSRVPAAGE